MRMIQIHGDLLLIGTTTNSILTAEMAPTALRAPLSGVTLGELPLTQVRNNAAQQRRLASITRPISILGHAIRHTSWCSDPDPDDATSLLTHTHTHTHPDDTT